MSKKEPTEPKVSRETLAPVAESATKAIVDGWYWGTKRGLSIWIAAGSAEEALSILGGGVVEPATRYPTPGEDYLIRIDGIIGRQGWSPVK
jgi:hypothetical protein